MPRLMRRKKRSSKERRIFFYAFTLTLCLFILFAGFTHVDQVGRKMSHNDETPAFRVIETADGSAMLHIHTMGIQNSVEITKIKNLWDFFCEFCCIPNN